MGISIDILKHTRSQKIVLPIIAHRSSSIAAKNHKNCAELLIDAWKTLPEDQKIIYTNFNYAHSQLNCEYPISPLNKRLQYKNIHSIYQARQKIVVDKSPISRKNCGVEFVKEESKAETRLFLTEIKVPSEILRNKAIHKVFIGDTNAANNLQILQKNYIEAVLNLEDEIDHYQYVKNGYFRINETQIFRIMDKALRFLEVNLEIGNVLIQCRTGKNLSAACVIGFFIRKYHIAYYHAKEIVDKHVNTVHISKENVTQLRNISRICVNSQRENY